MKVAVAVLASVIALSQVVGLTLGVGTAFRDNATMSSYIALKPYLIDMAEKAYSVRVKQDPSTKPVVMIVDFTLSSGKYRMWVINIKTKEILFNGLVAHGKNSGVTNSTRFSDKNMSKMSSIGVYRTLSTYQGKYGYSLKIQGLEKGYNGNAESRTIVVHPAPYVNDTIAKTGRVGNSWGCFALDPKTSGYVINLIKNNGLILAYYPDSIWLKHSKYIGSSNG